MLCTVPGALFTSQSSQVHVSLIAITCRFVIKHLKEWSVVPMLHKGGILVRGHYLEFALKTKNGQTSALTPDAVTRTKLAFLR